MEKKVIKQKPNFLNKEYLDELTAEGIGYHNSKVVEDLDAELDANFRENKVKLRTIAKMRSQLYNEPPRLVLDFKLFTTPELTVLHGLKHGSQTLVHSADTNQDYTWQAIQVYFQSYGKGPKVHPSIKTKRYKDNDNVFSPQYNTNDKLESLAISRLLNQDKPLVLFTRKTKPLFFSGLAQSLWSYDSKFYQDSFYRANPYIARKLKDIDNQYGNEVFIKQNKKLFKDSDVRELYFAYFHFIIKNFSERLIADPHLSNIDNCYRYTQLLQLLQANGYTPRIKILNLDLVDSDPSLQQFLLDNKLVVDKKNYDKHGFNPRHSTFTIRDILKDAFLACEHSTAIYYAPLINHLHSSKTAFELLYNNKHL